MRRTAPVEIAQVYESTRDRLIAQLRGLDAAAAAVTVPSCPAWTVREVVAHVVGLVADVIDDVPPPLGSDENTTRQVAERADRSLDDLCAEWLRRADAFRPLLEAEWRRAIGLTADLVVHVHDLAETLEAISVPSDRADRLACELYVGLLSDRAAEHDIALTVSLGDETWEADTDGAPVSVRGSHVDFLRGITGRRSRIQVEAALEWRGDASTRLLDDAFIQYGDFRPD